LLRVASNPFFPYMIERIEEGITDRSATTPATTEAWTATTVLRPNGETSTWSLTGLLRLFSNLLQNEADPPEAP